MVDLPFIFAEDQAAGAAQTQMQTLRLGLVALLIQSAAAAGVRTSRRLDCARSCDDVSGAHGQRDRHQGRQRPLVATDRHHR